MGFFGELGTVIDNIVEGLVILFGDDDQTNADDELRRARAEQR